MFNIFHRFYLGKRFEMLNMAALSDRLTGCVVLDLGSGYSPYHEILDKVVRWVSIDPRTACRPTIAGNGEYLPFKSETFDGVILTQVLEHVPEPVSVLQECFRVLKPNGWCYVSVPFIWNLHYEPNDYARYTPYGLEYLGIKSGLAIGQSGRLGGIFSGFFARMSDITWQLVAQLLDPWCPTFIRNFLCRLSVMFPNLIGLISNKLLDPLAPKDALIYYCVYKKP